MRPPRPRPAGKSACRISVPAGSDMRDVVLLDRDGKEIALDPVWRGPGRTLLVLAESMPEGQAAATLYFGGNTSRRLQSWSAKRSLLLETRRLPAGANVATFGGWQEAWKKSRSVDGAAFVPLIFHGDNPFGEAGHFLSRYSGLLKTGDGGTLRFYTLSDDVSYVMIDGRAALKWQGNHPPPLRSETSAGGQCPRAQGLGQRRVLPCHGRAAGGHGARLGTGRETRQRAAGGMGASGPR